MKRYPEKKRSPRDLFGDFSKIYSPRIDLSIEKYLENKKKKASRAFMRDIYGMIQEYCLRKGKRVRPLILLISYLGYGGDSRKIGEIIKAASTLELMHSMLLIQDDIIDRADVRRGGRALHLVFQQNYERVTHNSSIGSDIAIVAGDVLFANALEILCGLRLDPPVKNEFLKFFSATYESTAWGQILDSLNTRSAEINTGGGTAREISTLKTAYYTIYYPMIMGCALAGGAGRAEMTKIKEFSLPLGLAFQMRDDILGAFGSGEDTGKPADSDINEGKLTVLVENTLMRLGGRERRKFLSIFGKPEKTSGELADLRGMIRASGALDAAHEGLRELTSESKSKIRDLSMNLRFRKILSGLIDLIEEEKIMRLKG